MRAASIFYSTSVRRKSVYKIYRKTENGWNVLENVKKEDVRKATTYHNQTQHERNNDEIPKNLPNHRENEMKIQMLSKSLYNQIFKNNKQNVVDEETIKK